MGAAPGGLHRVPRADNAGSSQGGRARGEKP